MTRTTMMLLTAGFALAAGSSHAAISGDGIASFNIGTGSVSGDVPTINNPDGLQPSGQSGTWANIWTNAPSNTDDGVTLTFGNTGNGWGGTVGDSRGNGMGSQAIRIGTPIGTTGDLTYSITGLSPNAFYDLVFYNKRDSPGEGRHPWVGVNGFDAGNGVGAAGPLDGGRDQNFIGVQADGSGNISGTWYRDGGEQTLTAIAGVQVVDSIIPEPSSLALLALGGLMIARRRRG